MAPMRTDQVAAIILAGGNARRMGGVDKPLLELGGVPMLARSIAALRPDVSAIAISANGDPARYAEFSLPVLPDGPFQAEGPLAGVLAGLDWAAARGVEALLTVPGDTPFIPAGLAGGARPTARLRGKRWPAASPGGALARRLPNQAAGAACDAGQAGHRVFRRPDRNAPG